MVAYITSTTATDESDDELTVPAKGQTAEDINRQVEKVLPNHRKISNNKKAPNSIKNRMMDLKKKVRALYDMMICLNRIYSLCLPGYVSLLL